MALKINQDHTNSLSKFIKDFEDTYGGKAINGVIKKVTKKPSMTHDENPMELAEMLSPYQNMEGNIEVDNPFYSGLMLERKSIDSGGPSFRRESDDINKINKNNRSVIDKNQNNSKPIKGQKNSPLRLDSDITKLQRITPAISSTPQNKTPVVA